VASPSRTTLRQVFRQTGTSITIAVRNAKSPREPGNTTKISIAAFIRRRLDTQTAWALRARSTTNNQVNRPEIQLVKLVRFMASEAVATIRRPLRVLKLFQPRSLAAYISFHRTLLRAGSWNDESHSTVQSRSFRSYDDYVALQRSKLPHIDLTAHERRFRKVLYERLIDLPCVSRGATVVCLGARLGAEVRAFIDAGCFAVGVDLNPGEDNRFVVTGDFHDLQWGDSTVDMAYSNSLDHAFDLSRMIQELQRILKPRGHFILEADPGSAEEHGVAPDAWATVAWESVDDLILQFTSVGWTVESRRRFEYPRFGEQVLLVPPQAHGRTSGDSAGSRIDK